MIKMGIDEDIDSAINNIGYYAVIGYTRILNITAPYLEKAYILFNNVLGLFKNDLYVFFPGHDIPYNLKNVKKINNNDSNLIFYDVNSRKFYENTDKKLKNLPYLAGVVKFNDVEVCDLTDWISKVKYSTDTIPNIKMIVMAWTLESGALLNISNNYYAEVINDSGDNVRLNFNT